MNVLIVDDERIGLEMLERQLKMWGYDVVTAVNGLEAWEKYQQESFSVVISDWVMPGMDGLELIRNIRSAASSHYVYCILLTVRSQLDDLIEGMDGGADDFLTKPFDPNELRVRLGAGKRILELERSLSLSNARMKRELETAASIQHSMLPEKTPVYGDRFAWSFRPCDELGGDIFNVVPLNRRQVALYLLDVAGHGVSAALLSVALSRLLTTTANASSIVRESVGHSNGYRVVPPAEVLSRLNHRFLEDLGGERFFSIVYGVLDLQSHEFCYASGGHNPAILLSENGQIQRLDSTGPLAGVFDDAEFEQVELTLQPNDRLLIYSDGITEAEDANRIPFGLDRLIEFVSDPRRTPLQELLDGLIQHIENWSQPQGLEDDVSCLMAQAIQPSLAVAQ